MFQDPGLAIASIYRKIAGLRRCVMKRIKPVMAVAALGAAIVGEQ
jgi:hypothetical protein